MTTGKGEALEGAEGWLLLLLLSLLLGEIPKRGSSQRPWGWGEGEAPPHCPEQAERRSRWRWQMS